jgi:hypothetical protein
MQDFAETYSKIASGAIKPLAMGQNLTHTLLKSLLSENLPAGDIVMGARAWMLYNFWSHVIGSDLNIPTRKDLAVTLPQMQPSFYRDSWLKVWADLSSYLTELCSSHPSGLQAGQTYAATILKRTASAGLSLAFAGDLRSRLFSY